MWPELTALCRAACRIPGISGEPGLGFSWKNWIRRRSYELGSSGRQVETVQGCDEREVGKTTDSDLDVIAGKRDQLVGRIQEAYGMTKEQAQREVEDYVRAMPTATDFDDPTTAASKARRAGQP